MSSVRTACWIFTVAWLLLTTSRARADCYQVAAGTKLYSDVLGQTVIGHITAPTTGWFGSRTGTEPTLSLHFVALDGPRIATNLVAHVRLEDATSIPCAKSELLPRETELADLTWPDGGWAGSTVDQIAVKARRQGRAAGGRTCFAVDVPGVTASACVLTRKATRPSCIVVPTGKPVFAHADASTRFGATTKAVVAEVEYAIREFLLTDIGIVRGRDTRPARCPPRDPEGHGALVGANNSLRAMLPDGRDAGFYVDGIGFGTETKEVTVGDRTLQCFDYGDDVRVKICTERAPKPGGFYLPDRPERDVPVGAPWPKRR